MMGVVMNNWQRLAVISLATSGLFVAVFAIVLIGKDELDVMYCTSLPAGHFLPCMPSITGMAAAMLLTIICAVPIFALFSPLALIGSKRSDQ